MASLTKLLAFNMRERRRILGISQATLAERVNTSTHYIAMIELERKTPSLPMIERIAEALGIDAPELFSMKSILSESIKDLQKSVMNFALASALASVVSSSNWIKDELEKGKDPELIAKDILEIQFSDSLSGEKK